MLQEGTFVLAAEGPRSFVPVDCTIGHDFKADCPYKVKNFSQTPNCSAVHIHIKSIVKGHRTTSFFYRPPGKYLRPVASATS